MRTSPTTTRLENSHRSVSLVRAKRNEIKHESYGLGRTQKKLARKLMSLPHVSMGTKNRRIKAETKRALN